MRSDAPIPPIANIAALIGDPTRSSMLAALMGGQALTAGELAWLAGVTPQTASGHLTKLTEHHIVLVEKQGRHRYFRLTSTEVAQALEGLALLSAAPSQRNLIFGPLEQSLRIARTCYDHMAGRLAVTLTDALAENGYIELSDHVGLITEQGWNFLDNFGVALERGLHLRRPMCRTCLDWSERRPHLAGRLGAALLDRVITLGWVMRQPYNRALKISRAGELGVVRTFGLSVEWRSKLF
jgi:DNA-binding transcriptional ArsR family regulator